MNWFFPEDMSGTRAPFAANERKLAVCEIKIARKTPQRHRERYLSIACSGLPIHLIYTFNTPDLSQILEYVYRGTFPPNTRITVSCLAPHPFINKCRRLRQQPIVATPAHRLFQRHSPNASCRRARNAICFPTTTCVYLPSGHHRDHGHPRTWCS